MGSSSSHITILHGACTLDNENTHVSPVIDRHASHGQIIKPLINSAWEPALLVMRVYDSPDDTLGSESAHASPGIGRACITWVIHCSMYRFGIVAGALRKESSYLMLLLS